jgi:hypothetical protein
METGEIWDRVLKEVDRTANDLGMGMRKNGELNIISKVFNRATGWQVVL